MKKMKKAAAKKEVSRSASVERKTGETDIAVSLDLDGSGINSVKTGIPFFDHMLSLFSKHGLFDLKIKAKGDINVDFHHTVEDVGLCLGEAIKKAVKEKKGIRRYGSSSVPMMDALAMAVVDIGGRPNFVYTGAEVAVSLPSGKERFDTGLVNEFLLSLANSAGMDVHVVLRYGKDPHHSIEAIFKALGRAMSEAVEKDTRIRGVMSTKGKL